ncbi:MAG: sugar transferase [Clostridia bacterium]|nr:sugar transferase [Clostridia bacterium]
MREFFNTLLTTPWGITTLIVVAALVWVCLSALLYKPFFKRFYDIVFSLVALLLLLPVLLILTVVGAVKMKGNPFFTQFRPGKKGKIFRLVKFRTMTCEKDENGRLLPDEKRLTRYGKLLRSTSLDELPELLNVLFGQMSFVGPRPLLVRDMIFMSDEVKNRHKVRGGITGLAQVSGRNAISWEQKFEYDLRYVKKITLWGDIKILFLTAYKVFKRSDVVREGTESDIDYGDWLLQKGAVTQEEYDEKQAQAREILAK